ncbi:MAG: cytochrome C oxidase subunit II [Flavobacteriales bacterium]|nr:cytochrome C oxidase subunit II [Flavobacteriales bacterium]|tara:strand:+ start:6272 stop:7252 length:981 start_codon:yes stop_codon:yes gene_type:complete
MTIFLTLIVVFLLIVTLVQLLRVSELLSQIKNKDVNEITDNDNNTQGWLFLVVGFGFIAFVIWQMVSWNHLLLPPAATEHGLQIDALMDVSMGLILILFFILTPMLFIFAYKYRGSKSRKAFFFSHNNKLEVIWTVVPTIVLTALIIYGLKTWDRAMNVEVTKETKIIEIYAKQFGWTARYSGEDNVLGSANFRLVKGPNVLGVDMLDPNAADDKISREVHLVVNKPVMLKFRSQDVIHSAYLPHFRVQMNCVPGIVTQFGFTPNKTTKEMKEQEGEDFDYILLCNKICGGGHWNMGIKFIVETQEEFDEWYANQQSLGQQLLTQK